jgi:magnesium-transporting ATPase (P-type)
VGAETVAEESREASAWRMVGDPTEGALMTLAHKAGLSAELLSAVRRLDVIPFESEHRFMAVLVQAWADAADPEVLLKGAPEVVLRLCTHSGGQPLDGAHWQAAVADAAAQGQRVLALYRSIEADADRVVAKKVAPLLALIRSDADSPG